MSTQWPQKEVPWILVVMVMMMMMMMMMNDAFSVSPSTLFSSSPGLCQPAKNACQQKR
jgi:hypothetical protein